MTSRRIWYGVALFVILILAVGFSFMFGNVLFAKSPEEPQISIESPPSSQLVLASGSSSRSSAEAPDDAPSDDAAAGSDSPQAAEGDVTMAQSAPDGAEPTQPPDPPVPGQGGTCISGYIIDRYHQAAGDNWKVIVTSEDGASHELNADANGHFTFDDLEGGTWTVNLEVPEGWAPFTSSSFPVTLSGSGDNCADVRFKVEAKACLEVTKLDADGQMGLGQRVGLPDWRITAQHRGGGLSKVTDWEGKCRFENLTPGTWTVKEEDKTGWMPVAGYPMERKIELESPRNPGSCESLTFVNRQVHKACIQVRKVDTAGNPLQGWKITLERDDGTHPDITKFTDGSGYATFCGLALGKWTAHEEVKDWWRPTGLTEQTVELTEPESYKVVTFENEALGCVEGYKINHLDQGLAGWTITIQSEESGEEHTAITNKQGYFQFKGLPLDEWTVSETMQTGWYTITPAVLNVEITDPFKCEQVRFKNKTDFACLDVFKKDVADGAGLPDWEITVSPAYGGEDIVGETDGTGHVRFNALTPGTYVVSEETKDGWSPVTAKSQRVTLEATGICRVITFKNTQGVDPPSTGCRTWYKVYWGDTLYSIARRYNTTVGAIRHANGLYSNAIRAGQRLCIP